MKLTAMTNEELAAIEARAEAATPGPWEWKLPYEYADYWHLLSNGKDVVTTDGSASGEYSPDIDPTGADAQFIAQARTDIPALIAYIRELQAFAAKLAVQFATASSEAEALRIELSHAYDVGLPGLPPRDVDPQLYEELGLE